MTFPCAPDTALPRFEPDESCDSPATGDGVSFVELVLAASECSEDESEIGDVVDAMFDLLRPQLRDLREERVAIA